MKTMMSNLALIAQNTQSDNIKMIDIDDLHESENNFFVVDRIEEFAYTILGQGGVKDNLIVCPLPDGGYEIISGHRRTAAVRYLLEHGETISRLLPCLVQTYKDEDTKTLDLILMNATARQLSDTEIWNSFNLLNAILERKKEAGEKFGRLRETLAENLGVSSSQVGKLQNVQHNAIEPIKEAVANGEISISTANVIAQLDEEKQEKIASGDLKSVKPKDIKKDEPKKVDTNVNLSGPEDKHEAEPLTVKWDGETQYSVVKKQLMHLVNDKLHEAALSMNGMDFTNEFRSQNKTTGIGFETGIFTSCSFDRVVIAFSKPEQHDNIRKIEMTWRMAAKYVQQWIQEDAEKVDTNVNFSDESQEDEADSALKNKLIIGGSGHGVTRYYKTDDAKEITALLKKQHRNTLIGYMTLTLQAMGMSAETISDAQLTMYQVLDTKTEEEARAAYQGA